MRARLMRNAPNPALTLARLANRVRSWSDRVKRAFLGRPPSLTESESRGLLALRFMY